MHCVYFCQMSSECSSCTHNNAPDLVHGLRTLCKRRIVNSVTSFLNRRKINKGTGFQDTLCLSSTSTHRFYSNVHAGSFCSCGDNGKLISYFYYGGGGGGVKMSLRFHYLKRNIFFMRGGGRS